MKRIFGIHLPPQDPPRALWLRVVVWTSVVYASIPLARTIQGAVESSIGVVAFTVATLVAITTAAIAVVRISWSARGRGRMFRLAVLAGTAAAFAILTLRMRSSPEEALHFVQYGILAVLVLRAVSAPMTSRNQSAYISAAAVCILIGAGDEVVQWLVPERFFDFRDIGLNALASVGVLVAIRFGVDPDYLRGLGESERRGWARAARLWAATGLIVLLLFANTPAAVETYTTVLVPLRYLRTDSTMAEYGHAHTIDGIRWKSRFTIGEARRLEAGRAAELAETVRESSADPAGTTAALAEHRRGSDPLAFELVSRSQTVAKARSILVGDTSGSLDLSPDPSPDVEAGEDAEQAGLAKLAREALGEDMILKEMFPSTLALSGTGLSAAETGRLRMLAGIPADATPSYESLVDNRLVTSPRQKIAIWLVLPIVLCLAAADLSLRMRLRREETAARPQRTTSNASMT